VPEILQNRQMSFIALIYHAKTVPHTFLQTCNDVGLQFTAVFRLNEQVEKATTSTHFHTHDTREATLPRVCIILIQQCIVNCIILVTNILQRFFPVNVGTSESMAIK